MGRMYDTARWLRLREKILLAEPTCQLCASRGKVSAASVVDHIIAHKGNDELMWDVENLRPLCKSCHDSKTAQNDNAMAFGRWSRIPTWINPPIIPVTLVCGPPGAGKTTYTEVNSSRDSLLIDLDYIAAEFSGDAPGAVDMKKWLGPAMMKRNQMLADLSKPQARNYSDCWFIVSAPRLSDRRKWAELLRPKQIIVLETDKETCLQRKSKSPKDVTEAINSWWKNYTADMFNETQVVFG